MKPSEAIAAHVRPRQRVLLGTGAGVPNRLIEAMLCVRDRLTGLHLFGGLQLGPYRVMDAVRDGHWHFETWHPMGPIRDDVECGLVPLHLVRAAQVTRLLRSMAPDVFLTVVSPPGPDGTHSFGASVSYSLPLAKSTPVVIAEVNPNMPWVRGDTTLPRDAFTALVEVDEPLPVHRTAKSDAESARIARYVIDRLPEAPTVQLGLGSVPESLIDQLAADPPDGIRLWGMGIDGMVPLLERLDQPRTYVGGELLGTPLLYEFAHDRDSVEQGCFGTITDPRATGAVERFVSVVGAVEVDLLGQVNSEVARSRTVSGPGGGFDFMDGAILSDGGTSFVTLRSTAGGGRSTIVPRLGPGAPVTIPRHTVRHVVTEHGAVDLFGLTTRERAEALISVAHPDHRSQLASALDSGPIG